MALQKDISIKGGFTANYHKVIGKNDDYLKGISNVYVALYKDQATRNADVNDYIRVDVVEDVPLSDASMGDANWASVSDNGTKEVYTHLKTLPEYSGAADV